MSLIKFNDVAHTYSKGSPFEFKALVDVNFEINKGEFIAIIGHTGSGKSTLIQHINGLLKPTSGTLNVDGQLITGAKKQKGLVDLRQKAGLVFQFPEAQLFEETIQKDIEFGPKNFGVEPEERTRRAKELISLVGLDETYLPRSPFELSGGQKRRVAIAGILAMDPDILILDEPAAGLDPQGKKDIYKLIQDIHAQGKTIILVTHHMNDVLDLATRTIVMSKSKIVEDKTPTEIFANKKQLTDLSIDLPQITNLIHKLNYKGYNIPTDIKCIDELVKVIKEQKK